MTTTQPTTKPLWIKVCDGHLFEGHQGHWADCFFSNSTREQIELYLNSDRERDQWNNDKEARSYCEWHWEIREMTDEELAKFPEALEFQKWLLEEYGEC